MDFYKISTHMKSNGVVEISPKFIMGKKTDLMIKGGDFYAVWVEERKLWSTDEDDVIKIIDKDLNKFLEENKGRFPNGYLVKYMWDADSGSGDKWHKYCQKQLRDNFVPLDERLIFANQETTKESYATKKLPYPLEEGPTPCYDKLIGTLYSPEERMKLEWAIGAVVSGDSVNIQKFLVLYGDKGTGKSTFLDIVKKLFAGYWASFDSKALGSVTNAFALEAFKNNPLVAIDAEAKLDRIEDNTKINSLTAHESMFVNAKYEKMYSTRFNSFLFMGSNSPVKITDAKSGILRRLIDVSPTGNKLPKAEYNRMVKGIDFELGGIAKHCLDVYLSNPDRYDDYISLNMLSETNDFYNFVMDNYQTFAREDGVSASAGWKMYNEYCTEAKIPHPFSLKIFKAELHNYFREFHERYSLEDGTRIRSYYKGFRKDKFESKIDENDISNESPWFDPKEQRSLLDTFLAECPAQYQDENEDRPALKWTNCKTKLKDLDTSKLHYILPEGHRDLIRMDFDLKNEKGEKDLEKNLKEASKWPKTYGEISKSGGGVHLYYIYKGDPSKLSKIYAPDIEIKVNTGNSSIRRKLTKCNDIPIATISSGLPLKGDDKVVNEQTVLNERQLRTFIKRALNKEHHGATKPEVDFIFKVLEDKYKSGEKYDVSDMRNAVLAFAASSTHQSDAAVKLVAKMHFKSDDNAIEKVETDISKEEVEKPIGFFDFEVYPNFNCICWKAWHEPIVHSAKFPSGDLILDIFNNYRIVGHNCRRYDNHIGHAIVLGMKPIGVYEKSQEIITKGQGFYSDAYGYSYTDTLDYPAKKQSLKKWEIELKMDHKEMNIPWDKPAPEDMWDAIVEYCKNDVIATEKVWEATQSDFLAREILADLTGMTVNDTTNTLTGRLIFGKERNPQSQFNYRNLAEPVLYDERGRKYRDDELIFTAWNGQRSAKPFFPGYTFEKGKSMYRGEEIGEGGKVYAEPGIYIDIPVLDITSMHPSSIIAERLFGIYTDIFEELVHARVYIKHAIAAKKAGDEDGYLDNLALVRSLTHLGDKFSKYLDDYEKLKNLPQALKIAINSVYGLTSASFSNLFRDPRNKDNIVAKRGALFMTDLKFAVQERGFTVAHIKTDSIKIPNATPEIMEFVREFGKKYGYSFEIEDEYERMCLVNDAVYIAKEKNGGWTATGTQFAVPYVFKTLFSKEEIEFDDLCETKSVNTSLYLDFNEGLKDDHKYVFVGKVGRFCPIKDGFGGGELLREKEGKYYSVTGTKKPDGKSKYHWKEAEVVKTLDKESEIDISYYDHLCNEAITAVSKAGEKFGIDYYTFVNDEHLNPKRPYEMDSDDDLPF